LKAVLKQFTDHGVKVNMSTPMMIVLLLLSLCITLPAAGAPCAVPEVSVATKNLPLKRFVNVAGWRLLSLEHLSPKRLTDHYGADLLIYEKKEGWLGSIELQGFEHVVWSLGKRCSRRVQNVNHRRQADFQLQRARLHLEENGAGPLFERNDGIARCPLGERGGGGF
jgi:hypothetical protein